MTDTMVDRVARAIANAYAEVREPHYPTWEEHGEIGRDGFRVEARAAIAELLNPTDAMQAAARDKLSEWLPRGEIAKPATDQWQPAREVYQAAVRAAIEEARK